MRMMKVGLAVLAGSVALWGQGEGPSQVSSLHLPGRPSGLVLSFSSQALFPAAAALAPQGEAAFHWLDRQEAPGQNEPARPKVFSYSDGYFLRRKIHKYASLATVPLFIAQTIVGQNLYNGTGSESLRGTHSGLAAGVAVLFGVNTVTGVWNLWEGSRNPSGRTKRLVHGILMLCADAGFVATGALAPDDEGGFGRPAGGGRSTHRTVALLSMGVATVGYLYMLLAD